MPPDRRNSPRSSELSPRRVLVDPLPEWSNSSAWEFEPNVLATQVDVALAAASSRLLALVGMTAIVPGSVQPELDELRVPIFAALGEHDLGGTLDVLPSQLPACGDLTLFLLEGAGHNHNVARQSPASLGPSRTLGGIRDALTPRGVAGPVLPTGRWHSGRLNTTPIATTMLREQRPLGPTRRRPRVAIVTIKPERATATSGQRRERTAANGETDTRERVIKAAVECINDLGFYRGSSTNEIARRAGVTWGVIQWYFGNREGLMLAVLEEGARHMVATVEGAHIEGPTVVERMSQLIDVFSAALRPARLFGQPSGAAEYGP